MTASFFITVQQRLFLVPGASAQISGFCAVSGTCTQSLSPSVSLFSMARCGEHSGTAGRCVLCS